MLNLFIYQWIAEDENDELIIRGFGLDENNKNVCIDVKNFKPWISLEVLSTEYSKALIKKSITNKNIDGNNFLLGDSSFKSKLYFEHGNQKFKVFPLHFNSIKQIITGKSNQDILIIFCLPTSFLFTTVS